MRKILLFNINILICIFGYTQSRAVSDDNSNSKQTEIKEYNQHRIGANFGSSNSLGEFAETDVESENSGYAKEGLSVGISYQYRVHKNFSASLLYGSTANKFNAQAVLNQFNDLEPRLRWRVEGNPYSVRFFMAGAKGFIGGKVKGYLNPMFGYGLMVAPQMSVTGSDGNNSISQLVRESELTGSTVLGVSFGIDFLLTDYISFNMDGTYLTSKFEIEQVFDTFDPNGSLMRITRTYDRPYEVLNFSLGLALHF